MMQWTPLLNEYLFTSSVKEFPRISNSWWMAASDKYDSSICISIVLAYSSFSHMPDLHPDGKNTNRKLRYPQQLPCFGPAITDLPEIQLAFQLGMKIMQLLEVIHKSNSGPRNWFNVNLIDTQCMSLCAEGQILATWWFFFRFK